MPINFLSSTVTDNSGTFKASVVIGENSTPEQVAIFEGSTGEMWFQQGTAAGKIRFQTDTFIIESAAVGTQETMLTATKDDSVDLYHNNTLRLGTTATGVSINGGAVTTASSTFAGANVTADFSWADNVDANFGAGNDLKIYSDGADGRIEANNDDLVILAADDVLIRAQTSESAINCFGNGAVELFHNGSKKYETLSGGGKVTGDLTVSGGTLSLGSTTNFQETAASNLLTIGDVDGGDETLIIDLVTQAATNIRLTDQTINLQSDSIQMNATSVQQFAFGTNTRIKLQVSNSASSFNGEVIALHSTSTTAGKLYGKSNFAAAWTEADADSDITTNLLAIATGTNSGNGMLTRGVFRKASHGFTAGRPLYVSNTSGQMTNTAPSGSGDYVRVVGYAIDSNTIFFCPDNTWVENS
tara:strand:+ start:915 stop:2159 length:1245 start_codon:yes stop_codon:yes gene_type:complete